MEINIELHNLFAFQFKMIPFIIYLVQLIFHSYYNSFNEKLRFFFISVPCAVSINEDRNFQSSSQNRASYTKIRLELRNLVKAIILLTFQKNYTKINQ